MPAIEQIEVILEFGCAHAIFHRIADLDYITSTDFAENRALLNDCHIYLICKRPRVSIKPGSIAASDVGVKLTLEYKVSGTSMTSVVLLPRSSIGGDEAVFEASAYPHRELLSFDTNGRLLGSTLIANLVHVFTNIPSEARDVEVVYVGKGLAQSAHDRLGSHSTLQRILADIHSDEPDYEVFILTYAFDPPKKNVTGRVVDKQFSEEERTQRRRLLERVHEYRAEVEDVVALIEASVISYFRTSRYNTHYLDFPERPVKSLTPVLAAGFSAIGVTLDNSGIGDVRVFSQRIKPFATHSIIVPLVRTGSLIEELAAAQINQVTNPSS